MAEGMRLGVGIEEMVVLTDFCRLLLCWYSRPEAKTVLACFEVFLGLEEAGIDERNGEFDLELNEDRFFQQGTDILSQPVLSEALASVVSGLYTVLDGKGIETERAHKLAHGFWSVGGSEGHG